MDCKQEYTVFFSDGGFQHNEDDQAEFSGIGLEEIITLSAKRWPYCIPVAWATEWPCGGRGTIQLHEAALAAGRLIEKTPSGWVALGAEKQEPTMRTEAIALYEAKLSGELRKGEPTSADLAMIARDEPKTFRLPKRPTFVLRAEQAAPATAKPNPFPTTLRSPDCESGPSDHLNASRHQMAGMKG